MALATESSSASFWSASDEEVASFNEDGFLIVPNLFSPEEAELLSKIARADPASQPGPDGATPRMWLFSTLDAADKSDIFNAVVHSRRMVEGMMRLLGDEVYVYHYKLIMKDAGNTPPGEDDTGDNAWEWHQDYGYWYNNGALYPDFCSCMVAVDSATRDNGCLEVIRGSHKLGRLEHGTVRGQNGADPERVALAQASGMETVQCELEPGWGVFFHANTLHHSAANRSPGNPRWGLVCCYNTRGNGALNGTENHPSYDMAGELEIWEDESLLELGNAQWARYTTASL